MGLLENIASVSPLISTIITPLFGSNPNDYLKFSLGDNNSDIYFVKDNQGKIWVCNASCESIRLIFPTKNGTPTCVFVINSASRFEVTSSLVAHAKAYVNDLQIVRLEEAGRNIAFSCISGKYLNLTTTKISDSLVMKITHNDLILQLTSSGKLDNIVSLEISGEANEPCRAYRNFLNESATPDEMIFTGAMRDFRNSKNVFISFLLQCSYDVNTEVLESSSTPIDWDFLKTGKCLNE